MKYIKTYEQNKGITFKEWLKQDKYYYLDTSGIDCSDSNLIDLNGIEKFKNLEFLDCEYNLLTSLPNLTQLKNLKYLYCSDNQLTSLPDLSELKNLKYLFCSGNKLPYSNLEEYKEWYKKENPDKWNAKKYNL